MRVALKNIKGVESVDVSLSRGEAVATLAPGNTVRYEQVLRAIEKNGFVVKGATLVAEGAVVVSGAGYELEISGSNERLRLEPEAAGGPSPARLAGRAAQVTGIVPEVEKGKTADVIRYTAMVEK